jgi:diguanylate cyclase (GGDEF)-like protein
VLQASRLGPALQKFVAQCRRENRPVSVVCLDVDGLRRYNDQYGRRTGDRLLRAVADLLQRITREEDLIARYEEDQFVLALSATPAQALAEAQRLLNGLRRSTFQIEGYSLRLTASLGVAGAPITGPWPGSCLKRPRRPCRQPRPRGATSACCIRPTSANQPTSARPAMPFKQRGLRVGSGPP